MHILPQQQQKTVSARGWGGAGPVSEWCEEDLLVDVGSEDEGKGQDKDFRQSLKNLRQKTPALPERNVDLLRLWL